MRPKGKLFALVVLFAAVGLLTATGAFTTVEADRTADVDVSGDSSALLGLEPASNSEFANVNNGDELEISLNTSAASGTNAGQNAAGVNSNATTIDDNVFNITNNGANDVYVEITVDTTSNADVVFYNATSGSSSPEVSDPGNSDTIDDLANYPSNTNINGGERVALNSTGVRVDAGSTMMVGIYIETQGLTSQDRVFDDDTVTITANDINS